MHVGVLVRFIYDVSFHRLAFDIENARSRSSLFPRIRKEWGQESEAQKPCVYFDIHCIHVSGALLRQPPDRFFIYFRMSPSFPFPVGDELIREIRRPHDTKPAAASAPIKPLLFLNPL